MSERPRIRDVLLRRPAYRDNRGERRANWMELFYDLAFVVAVASLAHALSSGSSFEDLLEFALVFWLLQWAWLGHTLYNDRFDTDDLLHRLSGLVHMGAVLYIGSLHDWLGADYGAFVVSYGVVRMTTIATNLYAASNVPRARAMGLTFAAGFTLALLPLIGGIWVDDIESRRQLVLLAAILQVIAPALPTYDRSAAPISSTHLPERMGLFFTLVLGEALAAATHAMAASHHQGPVVLGFALALGIAFCSWWIYFSCVDGSVVRRHSARSTLWVYMHTPLTLFVVVLAVGLGENVEWLVSHSEDFRNRILHIGWAGMLLSYATLLLIGETPPALQGARTRLVIALVIVAVLSIGYAILNTNPVPIAKLASVLISSIVLVVMSLPFAARRLAESH